MSNIGHSVRKRKSIEILNPHKWQKNKLILPCQVIKLAHCHSEIRIYSNCPFLAKINLQLWIFAYVWLLNRPYENEVTSNKHNVS